MAGFDFGIAGCNYWWWDLVLMPSMQWMQGKLSLWSLIFGSWSRGYPLPNGSFGLRLPFHLSSLFVFPPHRLFHLPNLRFMHATYIRGQHNIFALKMGRACLNCWEHAGQPRYILWRRPFKILLVLHLRKNILLAKVAEVRALLLLCLLLAQSTAGSLFVLKS